MYGAFRFSAIAGSSTIFAKGAHGAWHFNTTSDKYQKEADSMMMHTSETFTEGRLKKTSALNQTIVSSGMKELLSVSNNLKIYVSLQKYKPAWFYFHSCFGQVYAATLMNKVK